MPTQGTVAPNNPNYPASKKRQLPIPSELPRGSASSPKKAKKTPSLQAFDDEIKRLLELLKTLQDPLLSPEEEPDWGSLTQQDLQKRFDYNLAVLEPMGSLVVELEQRRNHEPNELTEFTIRQYTRSLLRHDKHARLSQALLLSRFSVSVCPPPSFKTVLDRLNTIKKAKCHEALKNLSPFIKDRRCLDFLNAVDTIYQYAASTISLTTEQIQKGWAGEDTTNKTESNLRSILIELLTGEDIQKTSAALENSDWLATCEFYLHLWTTQLTHLEPDTKTRLTDLEKKIKSQTQSIRTRANALWRVRDNFKQLANELAILDYFSSQKPSQAIPQKVEAEIALQTLLEIAKSPSTSISWRTVIEILCKLSLFGPEALEQLWNTHLPSYKREELKALKNLLEHPNLCDTIDRLHTMFKALESNLVEENSSLKDEAENSFLLEADRSVATRYQATLEAMDYHQFKLTLEFLESFSKRASYWLGAAFFPKANFLFSFSWLKRIFWKIANFLQAILFTVPSTLSLKSTSQLLAVLTHFQTAKIKKIPALLKNSEHSSKEELTNQLKEVLAHTAQILSERITSEFEEIPQRNMASVLSTLENLSFSFSHDAQKTLVKRINFLFSWKGLFWNSEKFLLLLNELSLPVNFSEIDHASLLQLIRNLFHPRISRLRQGLVRQRNTQISSLHTKISDLTQEVLKHFKDSLLKPESDNLSSTLEEVRLNNERVRVQVMIDQTLASLNQLPIKGEAGLWYNWLNKHPFLGKILSIQDDSFLNQESIISLTNLRKKIIQHFHETWPEAYQALEALLPELSAIAVQLDSKSDQELKNLFSIFWNESMDHFEKECGLVFSACKELGNEINAGIIEIRCALAQVISVRFKQNQLSALPIPRPMKEAFEALLKEDATLQVHTTPDIRFDPSSQSTQLPIDFSSGLQAFGSFNTSTGSNRSSGAASLPVTASDPAGECPGDDGIMSSRDDLTNDTSKRSLAQEFEAAASPVT